MRFIVYRTNPPPPPKIVYNIIQFMKLFSLVFWVYTSYYTQSQPSNLPATAIHVTQPPVIRQMLQV